MKLGLDQMLKQEQAILPILRKNLGFSEKLLDLGCGNGNAYEHVYKTLVTEATGIELIPEYAQKAREKGLNVIEKDANFGLPFADNTFNDILCLDFIEHTTFPLVILNDIDRVLKPGGFLHISTPNSLAYTRRVKTLMGKSNMSNPLVRDKLNDPDGHHHFREYCFNDFIECGKSFNWKIVKTVGFPREKEGKNQWLRKIDTLMPGNLRPLMYVKFQKGEV